MIAAILPSPLCVAVVAFLLTAKGIYVVLIHRAELAPAVAVAVLLGPAYTVHQMGRQRRRWIGRGPGRRIKPKTVKAEAVPTPTPELEPAR